MKHLLSINDLSRDDARFLLAEAARLKAELRDRPERQRDTLAGKTLVMLFQKPSLRTRVSFDIGMAQLGGHPVYLSPQEVGLGARESVADVARVLGRMSDCILGRVFGHETLTEMASNANVPVINGLSDAEHPCQALADVLTMQECGAMSKLAYIGDGNNVCHSLMLLCAKLGVPFSCATPQGFEPDGEFVSRAREEGEVTLTNDPREAVQNAEAVYTDVWTSMGQEDEAARRMDVFPPFQINAELMSHAADSAILLHCLPAHRGEEVSAGVIDGPQSRVWQQAENRLHAQKAVLVWLLSDAFAGRDVSSVAAR